MKQRKFSVLILLVMVSVFLFSMIAPFKILPVEAAGNVLGTSTTSYSVGLSFQRKTFYAAGRNWVFYCDGSNMNYTSSSDGGITWAAQTTIAASTSGTRINVWYNGTYFSYAMTNGLAGALTYRQGTPNTDGSVNWSTAEQTISAGVGGVTLGYPSITVDSSNSPWISYSNNTGSQYYVEVTTSTTNNGVWTTAPGYPIVLANGSSLPGYSAILPLTSQKVAVVYPNMSSYLSVQVWNTTAWSPPANTSVSMAITGTFSEVSQGDNVSVAYLTGAGPSNITYNVYSYQNNSFGTDLAIPNGTNVVSSPTLSIDTTSNVIYCYWSDYSHYYIWLEKNVNGAWDSTPTLFQDETAAHFTNNALGFVTTSAFYPGNNTIGVLYSTKNSSPYNVTFSSQPVIGSQSPTYSSISTSIPVAGQIITFHVYWSDDYGVSGCIFGSNNSGTPINNTWSNAWTSWVNPPKNAWFDVTLMLNATDGAVVQYEWWCNDTSNNWNATGLNSVTVIAPGGGSFVGTESDSVDIYPHAVSYPEQIKSFYSVGRFWVFYNNGSADIYKSSTDGIAWSSDTLIHDGVARGESISVCTYITGTESDVYYAYGYDSDVMFRKGILNTDGTISWVTPEQTAYPAFSVYGVNALYPTIALDSNQYPFIIFNTEWIPNSTIYNNVTILKSSLNNGTWSTAPGFPYTMTNTGYCYPTIVGLNNSRMYVLWATGSAPMAGMLWNGSSFGSGENISVGYTDFYWSAVAYGDNVFVAYTNHTDKALSIAERTYGVGWTQLEIRASSSYTGFPALSVDPNNGQLTVFWAYNNSIYCEISSDSFSTYTFYKVLDESTETMPTFNTGYPMSSFYQAANGTVGLAFVTGNGVNPLHVKFAFWPPSASLSESNTSLLFGQTWFANVTISSGTAPYLINWFDNGVLLSSYTNQTTITNSGLALGLHQFQVNVADYTGSSSLSNTVSVLMLPTGLSIQSGLYCDPISPVITSSFNLIGVVYYNGTTVAPPTGSVTVYAARDNIVEGSTTSIGSDGTFQIAVVAPGAAGEYAWTVYAGANSVQNQSINVYVHGTTGPVGPVSPLPTQSAVLFYGSQVSLGQIVRGRTVNFQVVVTWTGATQIQINNMSTLGPNWTLPVIFPHAFYRGLSGNGTASISMTLTVPDTAPLNSYQMTFIFTCESGSVMASVSCLVEFDVTLPPASSTPTYQVQTIIGVVLATSLSVVLYSGTKRRKPV